MIVNCILTLLYTGGGEHWVPPLRFWSLEPSRVIRWTPNVGTIQIWNLERVFIFFHFFVLSFLATLRKQRDFLALFGKKYLTFIYSEGNMSIWLPKMLFRGLFYKLSSKSPPSPVTTLIFWSLWKVGLKVSWAWLVIANSKWSKKM